MQASSRVIVPFFEYYYYYSFSSFSDQPKPMVSHRSLSDSKSPKVSRTLLNILDDLDKAVVWMVSTGPLISKSSSPCTNLLVTVPRAPITTDITVTSFFQFSSKVQVLILLYVFVQFYSMVSRGSKLHNSASSFLLIIIRFVHLAEIR